MNTTLQRHTPETIAAAVARAGERDPEIQVTDRGPGHVRAAVTCAGSCGIQHLIGGTHDVVLHHDGTVTCDCVARSLCYHAAALVAAEGGALPDAPARVPVTDPCVQCGAPVDHDVPANLAGSGLRGWGLVCPEGCAAPAAPTSTATRTHGIAAERDLLPAGRGSEGAGVLVDVPPPPPEPYPYAIRDVRHEDYDPGRHAPWASPGFAPGDPPGPIMIDGLEVRIHVQYPIDGSWPIVTYRVGALGPIGATAAEAVAMHRLQLAANLAPKPPKLPHLPLGARG